MINRASEQTDKAPSLPGIGVVIVTYRSADVIQDCLDSLAASSHPDLHIVICDNASPDDTVAQIRSWAKTGSRTDAPASFAEFHAGECADLRFDQLPRVTLLRSEKNLGYAGGVNIGLAMLAAYPEIELFWILNPDSVVSPTTASSYAACAQNAGAFSLMGGRTLYWEEPRFIQSDGGRVNQLTGICRNVHQGRDPAESALPDPDDLDFISGANMVASREFLDRTRGMKEDYFLFYEEVDWAFRRGDLPLLLCPDACVYHHGGTSTGAGSVSRRPSPFTNYFNYRNQMRFVVRFNPLTLPLAYVYSMSKILRLLVFRAWDEAEAAVRGLHGLPPPRAVADQLSSEAAALAFAKPGSTKDT